VYRPAHLQALQRMSPVTRRQVIERLNPTGDALTPGAMKVLYQANYDAMLETDRFPVTLYPARDVVATATGDDGDIVLRCQTPEKREEYTAKHVIIAAGRKNVEVPFDDDLVERVETGEDGELAIEPDYSVRWKGMNGHKIYALNRARLNHGLTDANLTLLPVRAAVVMNSMFGREIYQVRDELCSVDWG
jgi:lysine N6-hydroxylase